MTDWLNEAKKIEPEIRELRREIHRHPEMGNNEHGTTELIESYLNKIGVETTRVLPTGVIGLLRANQADASAVAFRADIDALPVQEETGVPFSSEEEGLMHACGHDVHAAALLGAARILSERREMLKNNVVFIFQPDEEGDGGARRILDTGILQELSVRAVFGAHCEPSLPAGTIGIKYGQFYATACTFDVTVRGVGTHGAEPEKGTDSLHASARMCAELKGLTEVIDGERAVVTVGTFHAGTVRNIISDHAEFQGILRTPGAKMREYKQSQIREILDRIAREEDVTYELNMVDGYIGVTNHDEETAHVEDVARAVVGDTCVVVEEDMLMTTEDFGFYLEDFGGCFYHVGVGSPFPLHNPKFCPDESALAVAAAVHAAVLAEY